MHGFQRRLVTGGVLGLLLLSSVASSTAHLTVDEYTLVSSTRITRTVYENTYTARLTNTGPAVLNARASLTGHGSNITVMDGDLDFGDVPAGTTVTSRDTFTVRHDRVAPFDPATLIWAIQSQAAAVIVPDVVGSTQVAAELAITNEQLTIGTITAISSATVPASNVISQDPPAGASVTVGSAVNLTVSSGPALVNVPDVVGQTQTAAETSLTEAHLVVGTIATAASATVPPGSVSSQSPATGTSVPEGTTVDLVVSSGPALVSVPNVVGQSQAAAEAAIVGAHLTVGAITTASSSSVPVGNVIAQSPAAGTSISEGSAVNLSVSSGPALVTVPNVVGQPQADAESAITAVQLMIGVVSSASDAVVPLGNIVSQDPAAGALIAEGSTVNLVVSTGPATAGLPPDPATVAPPVDQSVATNLATATAFLYTGPQPIQTGVAPGTIEPRRAAVLRGRVQSRDGAPLSGVLVTVLNHPEFGQTLSRTDGMFDLAVNGGGWLTVKYEKEGYLPAQRQEDVPWQNFAWLTDVILIPYDTRSTLIDFSSTCDPTATLCSPQPLQVAQGSPVTDADGTRQATLLFSPSNTMVMTFPDGSSSFLRSFHVRATEYTVGPSGPTAMPATLPPTSGYTYAVELSVDEAVAAGASSVRFSEPLPFYVENFLGFPIGSIVPVGYYDHDQASWIPSPNGKVIQILNITNGVASLDLDGSGQVADAVALADLGITVEELQKLASVYVPGQSVQRIPIFHFSTYDPNYGVSGPSDSTSPNNREPSDGQAPQTNAPTQCPGSIIECESQILGEVIDVVGTPFSLNYRSGRVPGRKSTTTLNISLSGNTVPSSLERIELEITVAGRRFKESFPPQPNLDYTFNWDGRDAYDRIIQGSVPVSVRIGYVYPGFYNLPPDMTASFGANSGKPIPGDMPAREGLTLSQSFSSSLGTWDARGQGLGGWTLSQHHVYDPFGKVIHFGTGDTTSVDGEVANAIISTFSGTGVPGLGGDGGPAVSAELFGPEEMEFGVDGTVYILEYSAGRVRRVDPGGTITTILDSLSTPEATAIGADGNLYVTDSGNNRIMRVSPDGTIAIIAGDGTNGFGGDDGLATAASLSFPVGVAVAPDGSIFISDSGNHRVRRIGPDGIITTIAGNGNAEHGGDGGPATEASFGCVFGLALGPEGSLYVSDPCASRVRRIGADGIITTVAGNGDAESTGDGGPAKEAHLCLPDGLASGRDGSLYIADYGCGIIRQVGADGIIRTVAGNTQGITGEDNGPATAATLSCPYGVGVASEGSLFIAEYCGHRVRRVSSYLPQFDASDMIIPSQDGREVYLFNAEGKHLKTMNALTGAERYLFGYDSLGFLTQIRDGDGNVTTIERDVNGSPNAIVGPFGQRTALAVDADGYLASLTNPAGEQYQIAYTSDGLMTTFTDPRGNSSRFSYDELGRLVRDEDAAGGVTTLARIEQPRGYTVTRTTTLNQITSYQVENLPTGEVRRIESDTAGVRVETVTNPNGTQTITYPDGVRVQSTFEPDPRFGMQAPLLSVRRRTVPGGQTETTISQRIVSLSDTANPLSLLAMTDIVTINDRTFTSVYDAATRTITDTSAEGRQTRSLIDARGRVIQQELAPGIAPITVTYDSRGRVIENRQGPQIWTLAYDDRSRVVERTDASGQTIRFAYDDNDRVIQKTLPSGAAYRFAYDANGNITQVVLPNGSSHRLDYTEVDLDAAYTPPDNGPYSRAYNVDRQLTRTTLPGGRAIYHSYDSVGRVAGKGDLEAVTAFEYFTNDPSSRVARIVHTPSTGSTQDITFSYNGNLISELDTSGIAPAQVAYSYDDNFFLTNMTLVSGADTVHTSLIRDRDGFITGFGPFTLTPGGPGGALSQITDGSLDTSYDYDTLGRLAMRRHRVNGQTIYELELSYDNIGRIVNRTETINGTSQSYDYTYDVDGQLTEVRRNGTVSERYTYDLNGNRTSRQIGGDPVEDATYDIQDRLIQSGTVEYRFNVDGFLSQRGSDTFHYNTRGQLIDATVDGQTISYTYDGLGRLISRTDGAGTTRYLYADPASHLVTAVRSATDELSTLYYDTAGLLIGFERGGARYYVATDQTGTPRVVSDGAGAIRKVVEYDSFGNVIADSNPAFDIPIGFAGGLADPVTRLLHFGVRDYDSTSGRWTSRDPSLFEGGQSNLYVYVGNNPINNRDPSGLFCIRASLYLVFGGGATICVTSAGSSVCGEVGFGVGGGLGIDNDDLAESGTAVIGELSAECGPVGGTISGSINDQGCGSIETSGQVGQITQTTRGTTGGSLEVRNVDSVKVSPKCKAQLKVSAQVCAKQKGW